MRVARGLVGLLEGLTQLLGEYIDFGVHCDRDLEEHIFFSLSQRLGYRYEWLLYSSLFIRFEIDDLFPFHCCFRSWSGPWGCDTVSLKVSTNLGSSVPRFNLLHKSLLILHVDSIAVATVRGSLLQDR